MNLKMLATAAALVACLNVSRADIIGTTLAADGDGVIECNTYGFGPVPGAYKTWTLTVHGVQYAAEPGHIAGDILTDSPADPSLLLTHMINNDTPFEWTDYHATITLNKPFQISNVSVSNFGWTSAVTAPTLVGSDYVGYVDYYAGTPVGLNQLFSFQYMITFDGSVAFSEELVPTYVPEPSSMALAVWGLIGMLALRRSR